MDNDVWYQDYQILYGQKTVRFNHVDLSVHICTGLPSTRSPCLLSPLPPPIIQALPPPIIPEPATSPWAAATLPSTAAATLPSTAVETPSRPKAPPPPPRNEHAGAPVPPKDAGATAGFGGRGKDPWQDGGDPWKGGCNGVQATANAKPARQTVEPALTHSLPACRDIREQGNDMPPPPAPFQLDGFTTPPPPNVPPPPQDLIPPAHNGYATNTPTGVPPPPTRMPPASPTAESAQCATASDSSSAHRDTPADMHAAAVAGETSVAARTKPLERGDPVHAIFYGDWHTGYVMGVRTEFMVYWPEDGNCSTFTRKDVTHNFNVDPMDPGKLPPSGWDAAEAVSPAASAPPADSAHGTGQSAAPVSDTRQPVHQLRWDVDACNGGEDVPAILEQIRAKLVEACTHRGGTCSLQVNIV